MRLQKQNVEIAVSKQLKTHHSSTQPVNVQCIRERTTMLQCAQHAVSYAAVLLAQRFTANNRDHVFRVFRADQKRSTSGFVLCVCTRKS
jgi:hypothetical protein